jgi:hypothetical protein
MQINFRKGAQILKLAPDAFNRILAAQVFSLRKSLHPKGRDVHRLPMHNQDQFRQAGAINSAAIDNDIFIFCNKITPLKLMIHPVCSSLSVIICQSARFVQH